MEKKPTYEELEQRIRDLERGKSAEKRLCSSVEDQESMYRLILESISDTIIVTDDQGNMLYVCPNTTFIFGLSQDQVYNQQTIQRLMNGTVCDISELKNQHEIKGIEWSITNSYGKTRCLLINAKSVSINGGTVLYVMHDITECKQAEEALRESEDRYRLLADNVTDVIWLRDMDLRPTYISPSIMKQQEYTVEEAIAIPLEKRLTSDSFKLVSEVLAEELEIESNENKDLYRTRTIEIEINCKGGSTIWAEAKMSFLRDKDGEPIGIIGVTRDITERKQAEEALRKSERELSIKNRIADIFLTIPDKEMYGEVLNVVLDAMGSPYGTFAYINEDGDRIVPSMTRDIWNECKMPDKGIFFPRKNWGNTLWAKCLIKKKSFMSNGPFNIPDGHIPISRALATPIIHKGESIGNFMVGNKSTDYTEKDKILLEAIANRVAPILYSRLLNERNEKERKQAEEALRESEDKFKHVFDHSIIGKSITFPSGEMQTNKAFYEMLGYSKEEFLDFKWQQITHPDDVELSQRVVDSLLSGEKDSDRFIKRYFHKNGSVVWANVSTVLRRDKEENPLYLMATISNITERKQTEEALKISRENLLEEHNQRKILSKKLIELLEKDRHYIAMELHDNIGQILTSLKINLEVIDDKLKPIDTELGSLTKDAIKRANQAINDLHNIAQGLMPSILDALGLVSSLRALLNEFREHTDIKIKFFNRNVPKRFDQEKELAIYRIVQEALNNIIKHAKAKNVHVSLLKKGNVLFLSVEDDGVGFDQDKKMKISKGKGPLGLVIMRERAMQLDGELTVESSLGKGTHLLAEIPI